MPSDELLSILADFVAKTAAKKRPTAAECDAMVRIAELLLLNGR